MRVAWARYVRTGAAFLATLLAGVAWALTLILAFGTVDRTAALSLGGGPARWTNCLGELSGRPPGLVDLTSACAEVAAKASPTTTTTVAIRILISHRATLAPATPAWLPSRRISLAPRRGASINQCNLPAQGPQPS